jgi:hypothetical protein
VVPLRCGAYDSCVYNGGIYDDEYGCVYPGGVNYNIVISRPTYVVAGRSYRGRALPVELY